MEAAEVAVDLKLGLGLAFSSTSVEADLHPFAGQDPAACPTLQTVCAPQVRLVVQLPLPVIVKAMLPRRQLC